MITQRVSLNGKQFIVYIAIYYDGQLRKDYMAISRFIVSYLA